MFSEIDGPFNEVLASWSSIATVQTENDKYTHEYFNRFISRVREDTRDVLHLKVIRFDVGVKDGARESSHVAVLAEGGITNNSDLEVTREECGPRGSHLEELVLERADCLLRCERLQLGQPSLYRLTQETEKIFQRGSPYNYLQLAHYKLEELDEAAAAAFTFYTRNPHHEQIQDDVQRYQRMKGVQQQSLRDLEEPPYRTLFSEAMALLSEGKLASAVLKLEESLSACMSALRACRTLCEGTREREDQTHQEISEVIADYYTQVLQCKQRCILDLTLVPGSKRPTQDFIVSHLQSLHDTYDQLREWESAAETARSLLLFHPRNESLVKKLQIYDNKLGGKAGGKPRESIASLVRQTLAEKKLLYYAMENLDITFQDQDLWTPEDIIPESLRDRVRKEKAAAEEAGRDLPYEEVSVTLSPRQMNGTARVTLDGVLSKDECESLLSLVQEAEASGDGFRGRRSPHTHSEKIQSLTVLRALQMASARAVDTTQAHLFYYSGERARVLAQTYFETKPLHFSYSQLVCRTAIEGEQEGRTDVSHPVHADNCILDTEEKACWKETPAYIHRDYSAMLYLNDDFQGGDLFFTELDGTTVTAEVRPQCGRLVMYSSGGENAHGVRAVTRGRGCAIALWFTESAEHAEQERHQAKILVKGDTNQQEQEETKTSRGARETTRSRISSNEDEPEKPSGRQQRRTARKIKDEL
ncbi:PREDICTED: prolyl 3-hydroxylase 3 [Nanorana parkeri]|uniref:prolyl 3-hydroxylase 3 n=1 Tax=Nanorana parkeri TaxID=125878 RepID=UPI0008550248|nr:PREDICTED: prolyl 3-hydroxylase 3 [Nanorana parkeri]